MPRPLLPLLILFALFAVSPHALADDQAVYESPGCPSFCLGEGFRYVGQPDMELETYCTGNNCKAIWQKPGTKARYDLFAVAEQGEAPEELCLFSRYVITSRRSKWEAIKGTKVEINDRYYGELFGVFTRKKDHDFLPVEAFMAEQGHPRADPGYIAYGVRSNINVETRITIYYARNIRAIPKEMLKDGKALAEYMRSTFAERVAPL